MDSSIVRVITQLVVWAVLGCAAVLDLQAPVLMIRRYRNGRGPSPFPPLTPLAYGICVLFLRAGAVPRVVLLAYLILFHVACRWVVPAVYVKWFSGRTALHRAILAADAHKAVQLLRDGAEANGKDVAGMTPLHLACAKRHADLVEVLLRFSACPGARDNWGRTPLHLAVASGDLAAVQLLLSAGADPRAPSEWGTTPLALALQKGYHEIAELMTSGDHGKDTSPSASATG